MTARHEMSPAGKPALLASRIADEVPVLTTDRLILRAPTAADFETYAGILLSPRGASPFHTPDRAAIWHDFANYVAGWLLHGHGLWTVTHKEDRSVLGFILVGLQPGDAEPELGFLLTDAAEGKGYAFEAAAEARRFMLGTLRLASLVSYIRPDNARSIALAERLGARRDRAAEAALGEDGVQVWRHDRPEGGA